MTMTVPWVQDFAELTVVNAYEPIPRLGATRALPQVAAAMSAAAGHTFDVLRYRETVERHAARQLGFDGAAAVTGARAALTLATWLAMQSRPSAKIVAVHPTPRTAYSVYVTTHGLAAREVHLGKDLDSTLIPQLAAGLLVLHTQDNDLSRVLRARARCIERGIPFIIDAAAAPWDELVPLAHPEALIAISASKSQGGPTTSGFLLVGERWRAVLREKTADRRVDLLRPGKETLAGLSALLATPNPPRNSPAGMTCQLVPTELRDLGFAAANRQPYWRNQASRAGGTVFTRSFSEFEGGAAVADRIAGRLWNLEPPIIVGCRDNTIELSVDRLTALESHYIAAALAATIEWALAEPESRV
jgi:hypothetical protein